jgi:hypothetical protein
LTNKYKLQPLYLAGEDFSNLWVQIKYNSMKKIVFTIALLSVSILGFSQTPIPSPCSDSLYVVLKSKTIAQMTEREFTYFNQKEKDCSEFRKAQMQEEVKVETLKITKKTMNTYWTIAAIGVALSLIPLLLL